MNSDAIINTIFDDLQDEIIDSDLLKEEKANRLTALLKLGDQRVNLMLVGATGSGKSSTINALFDMSVADVGIGVDPETKEIAKFDLGNLTIWDTPGLGDSVEADRDHLEKIRLKLSETDGGGNLLIDLVLVVLDASSRDMAVSFDVISNTLIPCLGEENAHRILIALNQADMAMKGRHWNHEQNAPEPALKGFLTKKANSVKKRILDATGVTVDPVCYCAGYTDGEEKQKPYNLSKLLYYILMAVPAEKRLVIADNLNEDEDNWAYDDGEMDYTQTVREGFFKSLLSGITGGAEEGAITGCCILGIPGLLAGGFIGGLLGGLRSLIIKPLMGISK